MGQTGPVTYQLDTAVACDLLSHGEETWRYGVTVTGDWHTSNGTPNGGYILALLLHPTTLASEHPDPLSIAVTYFRPAAAGPAEVQVRRIRAGRRVSTFEAVLVQDRKQVAHAVVSTHDWDTAGPAEHTPHRAPQVPAPAECIDSGALLPPELDMPILHRYAYAAPEVPGWLQGRPSGVPEANCWIRTEDSRPLDAVLAGAMVDAFPPVTAEIGLLASATVQLTVHFRRRPRGVWALGHVLSRHVIGGYHDEDVELWNEQGELIAQSRQLAILAG